jgi:hypothetical protein
MEQDRDFICSKPEDNGMHLCNDLPHFKVGDMVCNDSAVVGSTNAPTEKSCVNWNQYYTECKASPYNPFQGTISFDNIGLAWVAIFLVSIFNHNHLNRVLYSEGCVQLTPGFCCVPQPGVTVSKALLPYYPHFILMTGNIYFPILPFKVVALLSHLPSSFYKCPPVDLFQALAVLPQIFHPILEYHLTTVSSFSTRMLFLLIFISKYLVLILCMEGFFGLEPR